MDATEERKSKPDFMDRNPNNPRLGFMYASSERNWKPEDLMDGIPKNPKLGFMLPSEERNSKPGVMDRSLPPRIEDGGVEDYALPPDFLREGLGRGAKSRASARIYSEYDDYGGSDWYDLERKLRFPEFYVGRRRCCVVDGLPGLESEIERAAAEGRREKGADMYKPIFPEGFPGCS